MNMKRIVCTLGVIASSLALVAGPHGGPGFGGPGFGGPGPRGGFGPGPGGFHHHHHDGWAIGAGILGAGLLASTVYEATHPAPIVVAPAPVVVGPAPVVVGPAPVVVAPPAPVVVAQPAPVVVSTGHYENRAQNVWVEGRYVDQVSAGGTVRVWQPGHYEQQTVQVYVP